MSRNQYAKNINFGKAINQNINRDDDPQNPLTTCIFPTNQRGNMSPILH